MSRWLIANDIMKGVDQDPSTSQNEVKTVEQKENSTSAHPTEGKGVQLNHQGFEGDGKNPVSEVSDKTNFKPLENGQGHTKNAIV